MSAECLFEDSTPSDIILTSSPRPTPTQSGGLVHPAVWSQFTHDTSNEPMKQSRAICSLRVWHAHNCCSRQFLHAIQDCIAPSASSASVSSDLKALYKSIIIIIIIIIIPYNDGILDRRRFWAISTASGSVRLWCLGLCWGVHSHIIRKLPGCLLQSTGREANRILLAASCVVAHTCNGPKHRKLAQLDYCSEFRLLRSSSFWTNWCHLMPGSIHRRCWLCSSTYY